jgi:hypothetical protein
LAEAIAQNRLVDSCQLIVRLHPIYMRQDSREKLTHDMDRFRALARQYPYIRYSIPKILSEKLPMDMPTTEMQEVARIVKHADVVVNFFSTLQLEAAIHDTPFVNIAFELPTHDLDSAHPSKFGLYLHNRRAMQSGAGRVATNFEELIKWINMYLVHPEMDRAQREQLVAQECGPIDGQAGRRTADFIFQIARNGKTPR